MKLYLRAFVKLADPISELNIQKSNLDMNLLVSIQGNRSFQKIQKTVFKILKNETVSRNYYLFLRKESNPLPEDSLRSYSEPKNPTDILNSIDHFEVFQQKYPTLLETEVPQEYLEYKKYWDGLVILRFEIADLLKIPEISMKVMEFLETSTKGGKGRSKATARQYLLALQKPEKAWSSWFNGMHAFEEFLTKEDHFLRSFTEHAA